MMDEEGDFDNNQRSVSVSWDDFGITPLAVTNTNQKSTSDKMKNDRIAKVEEEVNDSDDSVGELEEETTGGRATTTRSRNGSTNEENDTIRTSNESSTKSGNLSNDNTAAKEYGINDATIDYPKEGETHPQEAGALGKSNESALKLVGTGNDSNQRTQYNQSFLSSSTQSNGTLTRSSRNEKQDEYVKKGARVKSLLASALKAVADGLASRSGNSKADEMDAEKHPVKINADFVHVQDLAQKKSQECITLKRVSSCVRMNYDSMFSSSQPQSYTHNAFIFNSNWKNVSCKFNVFKMNVPPRNKMPAKLNPRSIVPSKHSRLPVQMPPTLVPKPMLLMHVPSLSLDN